MESLRSVVFKYRRRWFRVSGFRCRVSGVSPAVSAKNDRTDREGN
ncbi:hypothetical protein D1AOALGA4SA_8259 [Olavius algarvensis Delta 1 endosymbiont]|nr:hypothetical protein D1AOALGA4SA_8259 [Olavius algarvensis Delta 1 endosymbiont]